MRNCKTYKECNEYGERVHNGVNIYRVNRMQGTFNGRKRQISSIKCRVKAEYAWSILSGGIEIFMASKRKR